MTILNTEIVQSERVDYVRYVIRENDPVQAVKVEAEHLEALATYIDNFNLNAAKKHYSTGRLFDSQTRQTVRYIEVWGELAHSYFMFIPTAKLGNITRVDYRVQAGWADMNYELLKQSAAQCKYASKRRIQIIQSPVRNKKDGRDAGGTGLSIGSHGSERRVSTYKRGSEPYAVEVQFAKGSPLVMLQTARNDAKYNKSDVKAELLRVLRLNFELTISEYLGVNPHTFLESGTKTLEPTVDLLSNLSTQDDIEVAIEKEVARAAASLSLATIGYMSDSELERILQITLMEIERRDGIRDDNPLYVPTEQVDPAERVDPAASIVITSEPIDLGDNTPDYDEIVSEPDWVKVDEFYYTQPIDPSDDDYEHGLG